MSNQEIFLVTGVSGNLSRRVVEFLLDKGVTHLIGTTRKTEKAASLKERGVDIRAANFDKPDELTAAFRGATRLLLVSTNKIGQRVQQHKNAIDAAKAAGVKHVFYTSLQNTDRYSGLLSNEHTETENHLKASGLNYTILRNNLYMESLPLKLQMGLKVGSFMGCSGAGKVAYISREDCALAAAAALVQAPVNISLDINGAKAYSNEEVAQITARITGKPLVYKDVPAEDYKNISLQIGMPEPVVQLLLGFESMAHQGLLDQPSAAFKELTGQTTQNLEEFITRYHNLKNLA